MLNKILINLLFVFFVIFSGASAKASDVSKIDQFVSDFKEAVNTKNLESVLNMNVWEGLPEGQRSSIEKSFGEIIDNGILNIKIENIQDGEKLEFHKKGNVFAPNLPPVAQIYIEIPTSKQFRGGYSFYIGRVNDKLKFSHVVLTSAHNKAN